MLLIFIILLVPLVSGILDLVLDGVNRTGVWDRIVIVLGTLVCVVLLVIVPGL